MKVYLYNLKPKEYNKGLTLCFSKQPSHEQVIDYITKLITKAINAEFKTLCTRCLSLVSTFGLSNKQGTHYFSDHAGISSYSAKGIYLFQIINVIDI